MSSGTHYPSVRPHIKAGDVALFRCGGIVARFSDREETHAAKVVIAYETIMLAEFREWHGARLVTLSSQITKHPGRIDIYRPTCNVLVRETSAKWAVRQAGHDYGYQNIWLGIKRRSNVAKLLGYKPSRDMTPAKWSAPKICSQAVVWTDRRAAKEWGVDWYPCDGIPDKLVEPQHIAQDRHSYELLFEGLTHERAAA